MTNDMGNNPPLPARCGRKGKIKVNDDLDGTTQKLFVEDLTQTINENVHLYDDQIG